jgi:hypothetical protein
VHKDYATTIGLETAILRISVVNLLCQVVDLAHLRDERELGLEPISVLFFTLEHVVEQFP